MTSRKPEKPIGDILLVDNTPDNLRLLSELLTQQVNSKKIPRHSIM